MILYISVWNPGLFEWKQSWYPGNDDCFLDQLDEVE